jgi:hypothetical protein
MINLPSELLGLIVYFTYDINTYISLKLVCKKFRESLITSKVQQLLKNKLCKNTIMDYIRDEYFYDYFISMLDWKAFAKEQATSSINKYICPTFKILIDRYDAKAIKFMNIIRVQIIKRTIKITRERQKQISYYYYFKYDADTGYYNYFYDGVTNTPTIPTEMSKRFIRNSERIRQRK